MILLRMLQAEVTSADEITTKNKSQSAEHDGVSVTIEGNMPQVTEAGLWIPSRKGTLITTEQWRVLDGNLKFCFNGRIIYGPGNWYWWIFVLAHLLITTLVFIWFDVLPVLPVYVVYATVFGVLAMTFGALYSSFQIVFTDPGYVPRPDVEERVENLVQYHADSKADTVLTKTMSVNGKMETCTFCDICCVYRSQRAKHCSLCDCCIDRFDRHCPTFGTCIGRRNIGAYIRFLFFTLATFQIIQTVALKNLIQSVTAQGWYGLLASPTLYIMLISILHPPFGLLNFSWTLLCQLYNLMLDRTTHEAENNLNYSEFTETNGWRAKLHVFWTNFSKFVLSAPQESRIKPKSYVKTKAIKRVPQEENAAPRRQPRSFLSYSMDRRDVPVNRPASDRGFVRSLSQKITSNLSRLTRRLQNSVPEIPNRPGSVVHAPGRSSRVMPYPNPNPPAPGRPQRIIYIRGRQLPPQNEH